MGRVFKAAAPSWLSARRRHGAVVDGRTGDATRRRSARASSSRRFAGRSAATRAAGRIEAGEAAFVGMSFKPLFENDSVTAFRARMDVGATRRLPHARVRHDRRSPVGRRHRGHRERQDEGESLEAGRRRVRSRAARAIRRATSDARSTSCWSRSSRVTWQPPRC